MPNKAYWRKRAAFHARKNGVPVELYIRQINQESGFNPEARSPAAAQGIDQIVPRWHPGVNTSDPEASLAYGARLMASHKRKYGTWQDALSAYNSGRPWSQGQKIGETRNYVKSILGGKGYGGGSQGSDQNLGYSPSQANVSSLTGDSFRSALVSTLLQSSQALAQGQTPNAGSLLALAVMRKQMGGSANLAASADNGINAGAEGGPAGGAKAMIAAIKKAKALGLRVSENAAVDQVDPVHTQGSYHYRKFGPKLGRGLDVSGSPQAMRAYALWLRNNRAKEAELFYDPLGGWKHGKAIGAIGGHGNHVHVAY